LSKRRKSNCHCHCLLQAMRGWASRGHTSTRSNTLARGRWRSARRAGARARASVPRRVGILIGKPEQRRVHGRRAGAPPTTRTPLVTQTTVQLDRSVYSMGWEWRYFAPQPSRSAARAVSDSFGVRRTHENSTATLSQVPLLCYFVPTVGASVLHVPSCSLSTEIFVF
jgi:hypothetical protein